MDSDNNNNQNNSSSSNECIVLTLSPVRSTSSTGAETPTLTTPKIRLSKVEYTQRKSERDAKKAEEEAIRAEKKRIQEE
ncbi:unnamed protein product, partial [Adineta steineri]